MKLIVNPDGITAREINPLGEEPLQAQWYDDYSGTYDVEEFQRQLKFWQQAESKLRSFPTSEVQLMMYEFIPGSIVEAELLSNGKIKIVS